MSTCFPTGTVATASAIRLSFEPAHEVVDEHADAAAGAGPELAQVVGQVVDAVEVLHDDALDPQVVAPDLLDQLGVVPALDVDPALPGDPRLGAGTATEPDAVRVGLAGARRAAARQDHRPALQQEAGPEREVRRRRAGPRG